MDSPAPATRHLSLASMLLLCTAGLLIALALRSSSGMAVCQASGCERVLTSRYSHVGGWPVALIGAGYYSVMILVWAGFIGVSNGFLRRMILWMGLALSALAMGISFILVCIQLFVIGAVCPFCLASAAICIAVEGNLIHLFRSADWAVQPMAAVAGVMLLVVVVFPFISRPQAIVARVGGETITRAEMENEIGPAGRRAEWETYRAEKDWLDQKLTDILVQREAANQHISPGDLIEKEVDVPVDQQVDAFMKKNGDKLGPGDAAVVRQQVRVRFKADRAEAFVGMLMKKYGAIEYLEAPAMDEKDLAALPGEHRGANADTAPIRLVIFSDFGCEYCAHTSQAIAAMMDKYAGKISLIFHYLPLDIHPRGREAAIAAECAAEQNQFWKFHDALMSHEGQLSGIDFVQLAGELGLDQKKFKECLPSDAAANVVDESKRQADLLGVDATPAVFLNGRRIGGDLSETQLRAAIERLLK